MWMRVRAGANESQKTRNKKQNGLAHSRFIVCVTLKKKKKLLDSRIMIKGRHRRESKNAKQMRNTKQNCF